MEKIAVLSDIHGNTPALEAVLEDVRNQGCTRLFFLGDLINGIDPHGSLDTLLSWGPVECLQGNAEAYVLTPDLDRFPYRHEAYFQELFVLLDWFRYRLTPADLALISTWPDVLWYDRACLVHDSPLERLFKEKWHEPGLDPKYQELRFHSPGIKFPHNTQVLEQLLSFMDQRGLSQVFYGHTHSTLIEQFGDKLLCNAGSVGMPLDGDPRPAWVLVEKRQGEVDRVSIRRVTYEIERTLRLLDSALDFPDWKRPGMLEAYKLMLSTGIHWEKHLTR